MKQYEVYIGYGDRPCAPLSFVHLESFALGLGLPGFTSFDARGVWVSPEGDTVSEPSRVFRFLLPDTPADPWSIKAFAAEAKKVLDQQVILVTVIDVLTYQEYGRQASRNVFSQHRRSAGHKAQMLKQAPSPCFRCGSMFSHCTDTECLR